MPKANSTIKTVAQLTEVIDPKKLYSRQEVSAITGTIWANVLDASKGVNPKLKGTKVTKGKVDTWFFTGEAVLNWRKSVETRTNKGLKVVIPLETEEELAELKELLKKSKFAARF